jgi:hypothetical protein
MPPPNLASPSPARKSIFRSIGAVTPLSRDISLESPKSTASECSLGCSPLPTSPATPKLQHPRPSPARTLFQVPVPVQSLHLPVPVQPERPSVPVQLLCPPMSTQPLHPPVQIRPLYPPVRLPGTPRPVQYQQLLSLLPSNELVGYFFIFLFKNLHIYGTVHLA